MVKAFVKMTISLPPYDPPVNGGMSMVRFIIGILGMNISSATSLPPGFWYLKTSSHPPVDGGITGGKTIFMLRCASWYMIIPNLIENPVRDLILSWELAWSLFLDRLIE